MIQILKSTIIGLGLKNWVKNSFLFKYYEKSSGNPLYPILSFFWWFTRVLTPYRSVYLNNIRLLLPVRNYITHFRWYLIKKKEPEVREWVDKFLSPEDTLYDIGGNMGLISMYSAKRHLGISVYCFEPEFSNLSLIKDNLRKNDLINKVEVFSVALSDSNGLSQLHLQDIEEGAAAHTESRSHIDTTDEGYSVVWKEGIYGITMDDLVQSPLVKSPTALKIDTDGNELKILMGAKETLRSKALKNIIIEMPDENAEKSKKCRHLLLEAGFKQDDSIKAINQIWYRD